jgi:hypothetical protein
MKRYIEQLIEDLRNAAIQAPEDPFDDPDLDQDEALELELEESERFVSGPTERLSDIVGIPQKHLPAPGKLTDKQKQKIVPELIDLLHAYNFYPEYPDGVPLHLVYNAIYGIWEDDYVPMRFGQSHIEFCDYDEENCPFPGYCNLCKEFLEQRKVVVPENEFNVNAKPLKMDDQQIDQDFNQIEKEFYNSEVMTDEEGFIPGIHNYCDRWCERCEFTDKCRVFEMESEMMKMLDNKQDDVNIDFDDTKNIVGDDPADEDDPESDLDFFGDFDDDFDEESDDFFSADRKADRHPMIEMAYEYSMATFQWFKDREKQLKKGFAAQLAQGYADEVMEAEDVMAWYQTFIYAKLKRALSGYYELDEFDDADYDMNGSAKVGLIALDRSIEAATVLMRHLKDHRQQIREFRGQLEEIRKMAEALFPDARSFIRPGLDEV